MDRGIRVFLLSALALAACAWRAAAVRRQSAESRVERSAEHPQVIEPEVERRDVKPPASTPRTSRSAPSSALISIEDFGTDIVYGARLAYHFTEDFFAEATFGTSKAGKTSYENLSGRRELLTDSERKFTYYDLSLGWNVLPGEVFLGGKRAMPSCALPDRSAPAARSFAGDDHFTVTFGAGMPRAADRLARGAPRRARSHVRQRPARQEQAHQQPRRSSRA